MTIIAVTGATGFVGRHLVAAARARGWAVRVLVRDPTRLRPDAGLEVERWDAGQPPEQTAARLEGVSALCHAAALIPADTADPRLAGPCLEINALGTLALVRAAVAAGVPRLVHLSTGNAYAPAAGPVREDHPLYPSARAPYYLASKLAGEIMVDHASRSGRLPACILRPASVYGPGMAEGVVKTLAEGLRAHRPVEVRGRYGADFVHVDDVVRAVIAAVEADVTGPVNIGSGVRTTLAQLMGLLVDLTGADPARVVEGPTADDAADLGFAALDITLARRRLGFSPTPLREGLAAYLRALDRPDRPL